MSTYIENFKVGGTYRILFKKNQTFWNCYYGKFKDDTNKIKEIELFVKDRTNVIGVCLEIKCVVVLEKKCYWYKFLASETMQVVWFCMPNKVEIFNLH